MDLEMLGRRLSAHLPRPTVEKARALARDGVFTDVDFGTERLAAIAQGTMPYWVEIHDEGDDVRGTCACPAFAHHGPCKHLLGLILWAGELVAERSSTAGGSRSPDEILLRQAFLRQAWRRRLDAIRGEVRTGRAARVAAAPRSPDALVYEIDVPRPGEFDSLTVRIKAARRSSGGKLRPGVAWRLDDDAGVPPPSRLDARILETLRRDRDDPRLTGWSSRTSPEVDVPLARAARSLLLLARSGRCRVAPLGRRTGGGTLTLDPGGPWTVACDVERLDEGGRRIRTRLVRDGAERELRTADAFVPPDLALFGTTLARLAPGTDFAWLHDAVRNGDLVLPAGQFHEFSTAILEAGVIPAPGLLDREVATGLVPRPWVRIAAPRPRAMPRAEAGFDYEGVRVRAGDPRSVLETDEGRLLVRDADVEANVLARFLRLPGVREGKTGEPEEARVPKSHLVETVVALLDDGWEVQLEGRLVRAPGAFSGAVRSGQDWFDLEGGYDYDGQTAPLPEVLAAVRKGQRFLTLADGSQAILPSSFEDAWGVLAELATDKGDALRFAKSQGWLLDALLADKPAVDVDARFAAQRERLAAFRGIAPEAPPAGFDGVLRGYQQDGLGWLGFLRAFGWGGCLADDMGLGKTIQVLALLQREKERGELVGPCLVVAPRSVVFNWLDETARFTAGLRALDYTGATRTELRDDLTAYDVVVTTYGTLRRDAEFLSQVAFDVVVLDEAQAIKNPRSQAFKAARLLQARSRLALTGTPIENRLTDLWSLFEFLNPGMLGRAATFRRFAASSSDEGSEDGPDAARELLARAVRPFLLRRTKEQVATDLPPRTEQVIHCELTEPQAELYAELRDHYRTTLLAAREDGAGVVGDDPKARMMVLEALLRLRQAACHADLIDEAARKNAPGRARAKAPRKGAARSGKLEALLPLLEEVTSSGHKALVFSQFTSFLGLLRTELEATGQTPLYLDGATRDRKALVDAFQEDPEKRVFLISLKAGGVGLNLTAADYVFLLDPWWNPAVEAQAIDRTHRIGQTRSVVAYRLISEGTVEEKVLALQAAKRDLAASILTEDTSLLADLSRDDLELLLA